MQRFVIERELPGAGLMAPAQLEAIARRSCDVLREMGPSVQWLHSYVTDDKIFCIYLATDEAVLFEHARRGRFPADVVLPVRSVIDPVTAG